MKLKLSLAALALGIMCSCGGNADRMVSSDTLDQAEYAIDQGSYDEAQSLLDKSFENVTTAPTEIFGRASILYMRLSENLNEDTNVAQANLLYIKSFATSPDSALEYYKNVPLELSQYVSLLSTLSRTITSPPQLTGDTLSEEEYVEHLKEHHHDHD